MARINHVALKVTDLETATRFYETVFGFRQVGTGRSRGHISRHLTDGYVDLALMVMTARKTRRQNSSARARRSIISASQSKTARRS
jgi:catechol 2,3-dioxygenase-like lactoylglutathione lyase family enzyme